MAGKYGAFYTSLKRGDVVVLNDTAPDYLRRVQGKSLYVSSKSYGYISLKLNPDNRFTEISVHPSWIVRQANSLEDML